MLITNNHCFIKRVIGFDLYGQPKYSARSRMRCVVARVSSGAKKSSVRADSSASRGRVIEEISDGLLLVPHMISVSEGDKIEVVGALMKVSGVSPKYDSFGRFSHKEVVLSVWVSNQSDQ